MSRISMSRCRAACASANIRSWPQRSHVTFINQDGNALNGLVQRLSAGRQWFVAVDTPLSRRNDPSRAGHITSSDVLRARGRGCHVGTTGALNRVDLNRVRHSPGHAALSRVSNPLAFRALSSGLA